MDRFPPPPDERLTLEMLRRIQAGDGEAWREWYDRYHDELLFAIRANLGPRLRAVLQSEDVLQSVALEAFQAMPRFEDRGRGSLRGFLHRLIVHKIQDRARAASAKKRDGAVPLTGELERHLAASDAPGGEPTYRDGRYGRLERGLRALSPEMREIIVLRKVEGLSSKDAAARMERSDVAVRKLYSRAVARLTMLVDQPEQ
ncbi:MAG: RNA polymerase sigma factor [Planctomycetota bacterium]